MYILIITKEKKTPDVILYDNLDNAIKNYYKMDEAKVSVALYDSFKSNTVLLLTNMEVK